MAKTKRRKMWSKKDVRSLVSQARRGVPTREIARGFAVTSQSVRSKAMRLRVPLGR